MLKTWLKESFLVLIGKWEKSCQASLLLSCYWMRTWRFQSKPSTSITDLCLTSQVILRLLSLFSITDMLSWKVDWKMKQKMRSEQLGIWFRSRRNLATQDTMEMSAISQPTDFLLSASTYARNNASVRHVQHVKLQIGHQSAHRFSFD